MEIQSNEYAFNQNDSALLFCDFLKKIIFFSSILVNNLLIISLLLYTSHFFHFYWHNINLF